MKNLIGILALLLMNTLVFGNTDNNVKPELKVMAKSGLKLRLSPNLDSPVLDVIQYGESVTQTDDFVPSLEKFNVNWVKGSWIKVNYNNQVGFIFDGFVSELSVPSEALEFASTINEISQAVYNYSFHKYPWIATDTLTDNEMALTTLSILGETELFVHDSEYMSKVEATIPNVRIMDVYHLVESMMDTRAARSALKESTMFFSDASGEVNKIKISGGQITIKILDNGSVKLSCKTIHEGC
ncbi:SH3 domain-containing protein [Portibacter lacus]|uniref:SH3b domain-containing protein n=1 Tax=Portibacter lacus TaxID=1099794 RepID=A0AA37SRS5_9BACT|nr:SH3 domain-containing protein [Portibacter lacus]GLR16805.1 hypothetical protein GCM10007940_14200 [Portibacter lacus]